MLVKGGPGIPKQYVCSANHIRLCLWKIAVHAEWDEATSNYRLHPIQFTHWVLTSCAKKQWTPNCIHVYVQQMYYYFGKPNCNAWFERILRKPRTWYSDIVTELFRTPYVSLFHIPQSCNKSVIALIVNYSPRVETYCPHSQSCSFNIFHPSCLD